MPDPAALVAAVADREHPPLFAAVSGAHLYGFPSADSDVDLRGAHLLPLRQVIGLGRPAGTQTVTEVRGGVEVDLVTHDLAKFVRMLLRPDGYVLEQLLSPLVVLSGPTHAALVELAPGLPTRGHVRHYEGFAAGQWRLFERTGELKPLLYTFRVLLTGIRLLRGGGLVAHLPTLAEDGPRYLGDLVRAKADAEHGLLAGVPGAPAPERLAADVAELRAALAEAGRSSALPDRPAGADALEDLVVTTRLAAA
ncbi:nucleotidyltransferase domain-containing protein [Streptomyces sp. 549]|uniref:nucleotidyltransferase domain-containing protein n=1 Tax=Streptomyces sp. 549 TaxID=3049076 RepID=UPI0024C43C3A|nr:nucleotidyltransferase domain-containing protein [Streptomyces sp. 549]MDK1475452.1 nucleotidyltransferase domain-containing protein [Streptomyces sp. 549]